MKPEQDARAAAGAAAESAAGTETGRLWTRSGAYALLAWLAGGATLLWGLAHHRLLLYGDATAHLAIARRMVDSATPGLSQWGTVWLPLPHLLMTPLVWIDAWWRNGLAGAVPSVLALGVATWLLHRIVRRAWGAAAAAWAAAFFCLNPSLLYLSSVPMTESMYLATFLGLVDQCSAYQLNPSMAAATAAGGWGLAASLSRYDGWFMLPFALVALLAAPAPEGGGWKARLRVGVRFCWLTGAGPVFWGLYNWYYFKDPLAFARGPYSARQIYLKALRHGGFRYPGDHDLFLAGLYFLKTASLTCGVALMILGLTGLLLWSRRRWHAGAGAWSGVLLLVPLPWYVWAMWSGNVPIFLPQYWPHGFYNLRYGVQLLPAVAAYSGLVLAGLLAGVRRITLPHLRGGVALGLAVLCGGGYLAMLGGAGPVAYAEAVHNAPGRVAMQNALAAALQPRRRGQRILMYYGTYPGAAAEDGIAVRDLIQESNFGLWDAALAAPQNYVDWAVIEANGPVAAEINYAALGRYFHRVAALKVASQPEVDVYRRKRPDPAGEQHE